MEAGRSPYDLAVSFFRRLRRGPPPEHQAILGNIGRLLRVASEHPEGDDASLVSGLVAAGVTERLAWRLVVFVPIAFGRPVVERFGIPASDTYILSLPPRFQGVEKALRGEPEYRAAADHLADFADHLGYSALAGRGPEVNAMNSALKAGRDPKGGRLQPVVVTLNVD